MRETIPTVFNGNTSYDDAIAELHDVVKDHEDVKALQDQSSHIQANCRDLMKATRHHLGLAKETKLIWPMKEKWIRGGFDICVPLRIESKTRDYKVIIRCPSPFALAEAQYPGTIDEKIRSEVGAYVWMHENCSDIRIPQLHGFGLSHAQYTHESALPWYWRAVRFVKRSFQTLFNQSSLTRYVESPVQMATPLQYMLIEHIAPDVGQQLSESWRLHKDNPTRRKTLCHSISRVMLSLVRIPQPRIGSFRFNDDCTVTLTARPALASTVMWENNGAEKIIGDTYDTSDSFVADMLDVHDSHFTHFRNATDSEQDCHEQMAARVILRATAHRHTLKQYRNGPFLVRLTDMHHGNMFVDKEWNITCLIDLEWLCSMPPESLPVPYWLSGTAVDNIKGDNLEKFDAIRKEFLDAFEQEQSKLNFTPVWSLEDILNETWESKTVWFWQCLRSVDATLYLVTDHLCPPSAGKLANIARSLSSLWCEDSAQAVVKKIAEYEKYKADLQRLYE